MRVLGTILSIDYLHNRVRAQGGAYGCGITFDRAGNVSTFSYRDPNLQQTLSVYDNMAQYIKDISLDDSQLTSYIIGTMSRLDPAATPHMKGETAVRNYISNISQADVQKERDEVLATKLTDVISLADLLEKSMNENYCCVLGNENKIQENEALFNKLVSLKK